MKTPVMKTGARFALDLQREYLRVVAISHAVLARQQAGATAGLHRLSWWAKVRPLRRAVSRHHPAHSVLRRAHGAIVYTRSRLAVSLAERRVVLLKTGLAVAATRPAIRVSEALSRSRFGGDKGDHSNDERQGDIGEFHG
jgi:hypothetical protein